MKLFKLLAITLFVVVIMNCAKNKEITFEQYEENGIRITKNNGIPADTTLSIELKEVGFIDMENNEGTDSLITFGRSFDFDKAGNLYILDARTSKIHKYDKYFKLISIFGGKGQGPGEFIQAANVIVKEDTLIVPDVRSWKINKLEL
ncbi:MAG: hypothetical protein GQ534_03025, partial [Candidatus Delongbacteria bacterium]|nr:hypothetical protein [Candidatus Delongbacteria bacterium]